MARFRIIDNNDNENYKIGLTNSIINLVLFSIVNVLKASKILRAITGVIGIAFLLIALYIFFDRQQVKWASPALFSGSLLILIFSLSASFISIVLENDTTAAAEKEIVQAEETYEQDTKDLFSFLDVDTKRLTGYYVINQKQSKNSFAWAVFAMLVGLTTIIFGIWLFYLGNNNNEAKNTLLASLATIAGVIVNIISGLFIYLYNKSQKRSLIYFNQLIKNQQLGISIRIAESIDDLTEKNKLKAKIISELFYIIKEASKIE